MVEESPEELRRGEIYLVGENGHFSCVGMMCPCGCGEVIQLNLVAGTRPVWAVERDSDTGAVTLRPSIWRTSGCRSHFLVRGGRVQWVSRTTNPDYAVRREKAPFLSGCESRPATVAPAGSSRSGRWRQRHRRKHSDDKGPPWAVQRPHGRAPG